MKRSLAIEKIMDRLIEIDESKKAHFWIDTASSFLDFLEKEIGMSPPKTCDNGSCSDEDIGCVYAWEPE